MADVRALLAAERQSRRITHPHLSYTKTGMLMCNVCDLNVKSESLWPGHLKSANHRKNVAAQAARKASVDSNAGKGVKRKIDDVDGELSEERDDADIDARKKPKSRPESALVENGDDAQAGRVLPQEAQSTQLEPEVVVAPSSMVDATTTTNDIATVDPPVDEDEWAAFEREVAPLAQAKPDYTSATIVAAPVSADQVKAQENEDRRRRVETEAEDEKEDELGKMAEEFDVMEEMEERVRKLREKRDALRMTASSGDDTGQATLMTDDQTFEKGTHMEHVDEHQEDDEDDDEDADDWYS